MAWLGSSGGCAVYYFITSWLVGLSNYLVVCLVCMILVLETLFTFQISSFFHIYRSREQPLSWLDCTSASTSFYPWWSSPSCRPSRSSSSGPPSSPSARASASSPQGLNPQLKKPLNYRKLSQGRNVRLVHPFQAPPPPPSPCRPCPPLPPQAQVPQSRHTNIL